MTDKKLTDNEIIKALKCCMNWHDKKDCAKCPMDENKNLCITELRRLSFDLINRLQAEIERLKQTIEDKGGLILMEFSKAEAYKEFAERLLACYEDFDEENEIITYLNLVTGVKDVLKELVGDSSAD